MLPLGHPGRLDPGQGRDDAVAHVDDVGGALGEPAARLPVLRGGAPELDPDGALGGEPLVAHVRLRRGVQGGIGRDRRGRLEHLAPLPAEPIGLGVHGARHLQHRAPQPVARRGALLGGDARAPVGLDHVVRHDDDRSDDATGADAQRLPDDAQLARARRRLVRGASGIDELLAEALLDQGAHALHGLGRLAPARGDAHGGAGGGDEDGDADGARRGGGRLAGHREGDRRVEGGHGPGDDGGGPGVQTADVAHDDVGDGGRRPRESVDGRGLGTAARGSVVGRRLRLPRSQVLRLRAQGGTGLRDHLIE